MFIKEVVERLGYISIVIIDCIYFYVMFEEKEKIVDKFV